MRGKIAILALAAALAWLPQAQAGGIGLSVPLSEGFARLGAQMRVGAEAASPGAVAVEDDGCSAEGGARAADAFVERKVRIVIGYLCTEAIEAALPILAEAGIPVVMVGIRTNALTDRRDKTGWPVWRIAVRADAEGAAVASILTERWRDQLFAIVDDGTLYGRELAEAFRFSAEQTGLKPVFVDTFRPQLDNQAGLVARLRQAGASHVFVGGERDDVAAIAQSAAERDYELTVVGGEALRAAGERPLRAGVLMVGLPEWADIAAPEAVAALQERGIQPEGYVLPGFAAAQLAAEALARATRQDMTVAEVLRAGSFETALGPIRFDGKGDRVDPPYALFRFDGETFLKVEDE